MKKILFILVVASTLTQVAYSQKAVLDITCMETLIANHKVQHTSFSKVKENEAQISLIQKQISEKMVQIEFFQSKFYNSLKSSKLKNTDWVLQVNKVLGYHSDEGSLKDILNIIGEQPLYKYILDKYKRITNR